MSAYQWLLLAATLLPPLFLQVSAESDPRPPFDRLLLAFDDGLGVRIASFSYWLLYAIPGLHRLGWTTYGSVAGLMALHFAWTRPGQPNLPLQFVVSSGLGFVAYLLYPAFGPAVYVPDYYASVWPISGAALAFPSPTSLFEHAPRNTMPSLHAMWAYLLIINAWCFRGWRRALFVLLGAVMLLATLSVGHWFIDIVPSVPFAIAMQILCSGRPGLRLAPCLLSAGLVLVWMAALQSPWCVEYGSAWVRWVAIAATLAASASLLAASQRRTFGRPLLAGVPG